jgi:hypothetical protein
VAVVRAVAIQRESVARAMRKLELGVQKTEVNGNTMVYTERVESAVGRI